MTENTVPIVPAARPVFSVDDRRRITALIDESLRTGSLTLGPLTEQFEAAVADHVGSRHAIAVGSGTAALEIVLRTIGVEGRHVVVPVNTFFATAAAVVHAGGIPRFVDIDRETLTIGLASAEAALEGDVAAVIPVHIGGTIGSDIVALRALCDERGAALVEDAAHAHGSTLDGRHAGTFGYAGTFSFYPTKVVTSGEGGVIVTDDDRVNDEARIYRDQGKAGFVGGAHVRMGYAWRMSELHAAVGLTQWEHLDEYVDHRSRIATYYDAELTAIDGVDPVRPPLGCRSNYYKYVALLAPGLDRDAIKAELRERYGVSLSGEVYARPLHREPVFTELATGDFPVADDICGRHICLPVHSDMTDEEAERVVTSISEVVGRVMSTQPPRGAPTPLR
jgi:dTDP-4-amino-4,6-dideoxygalactose transaminase